MDYNKLQLLPARAFVDINFFFSIINIISFDSTDFDLILEDCTKHEILPFSHVTVSRYIFVAMIPGFLKYKDN